MPNQRIDVLGPDPARLELFTGRVLSSEPDEVLQSIVEEAATGLTAPIALVSLLLERTQVFRAHTGLPDDLVCSSATDRDVSFCQYVVRDGAAFEVTDAANDPRVPRDLVDRYGIQAYLGAPIRVRRSVIGSLCVIDVEPRSFSETERTTLFGLADRASDRLDLLARARPRGHEALVGSATSPMFSELRNLMTTFPDAIRRSRVAVAELRPLTQLVNHESEEGRARALGCLSDAPLSLFALDRRLEELESLYARMEQSILHLEQAIIGSRSEVELRDVLKAACGLTEHSLRSAGGCRYGDPPHLMVALRRTVAVTTVAAALSHVTGRLLSVPGGAGGVVIDVRPATDRVALALRAPGLGETDLLDIASVVAAALGDDVDVTAEVEGQALVLGLPLVTSVRASLTHA